MPLGTEVGIDPGDIVLDGDSAPPRNGHSSSRLFGPCLLWPKRSPISATAQVLFFRIIINSVGVKAHQAPDWRRQHVFLWNRL